MKALSSIRPTSISKYIWGYLYGRNGRTLTRYNDSPWIPLYHAYELHRQVPQFPVLPAELRNTSTRDYTQEQRYHLRMRTYWSPWNINAMPREEAVNPICGRLPTRSIDPTLTPEYPGQSRDPHRCPDCVRILADRGAQVEFAQTIIQTDPWTSIDSNARPWTADPVSGL